MGVDELKAEIERLKNLHVLDQARAGSRPRRSRRRPTVTIQEELRGEASAQRALAMTKHGIACADLLDRAARALDAAEKGLDRLLSIEAKLTMHESTTTAKWNEYVAAMSQARAALAEIRGGK